MLGFDERTSDNSVSEDWFLPLLACASRMASQAKRTTFLSEYMVPVFVHVIVVCSLIKSQHLQLACIENNLVSTTDNKPIIIPRRPHPSPFFPEPPNAWKSQGSAFCAVCVMGIEARP